MHYWIRIISLDSIFYKSNKKINFQCFYDHLKGFSLYREGNPTSEARDKKELKSSHRINSKFLSFYISTFQQFSKIFSRSRRARLALFEYTQVGTSNFWQCACVIKIYYPFLISRKLAVFQLGFEHFLVLWVSSLELYKVKV